VLTSSVSIPTAPAGSSNRYAPSWDNVPTSAPSSQLRPGSQALSAASFVGEIVAW
jgi:hypothetical protein